MMMKLLFLDIDGVMTTVNEGGRNGPFETEIWSQDCVEVLNAVVKESDCQIVLSSDWRLHFNLRQIWDIFKFNKVDRMPLGFTGLASYTSGWTDVKRLEEDRGIEIKRWLGHHGFFPEYKMWCAVDDMNLAPHIDRFVRTNWKKGLTTDGMFDKLVNTLKGVSLE